MAGMMTARVSQENFDEVVKENMEDFEMSPEDAVKDAIDQFHKQGVSLDNLDLSPPTDENRKERADFNAACEMLDECVAGDGAVVVGSLDVDSVISALDTIEALSTPDGEAPKAPKGYKIITKDSIYRSLLVTNSGIFSLMSFLGVTAESKAAADDDDDEDGPPQISDKKILPTTSSSTNDSGPCRQILLATLSLLRLLTKESQELRDKFLAQKLVIRLLGEKSWREDGEVCASLIALVKITCKVRKKFDFFCA